MNTKPFEYKSSILDEHPPLPLACITTLDVRHLHRFLAKALLVAVSVASYWTDLSVNAAESNRLIVKLKPVLSEEMEPWVTTAQPALTQPPQGVRTWLAKHNLSHVESVYPKLVRAKRQSGQSYRQMAESVRAKFARRAARRTGAFEPPEVARTYLVVPNARTPAELEKILAGLKADLMVEFAQREQAVHACMVPNDPYFSSSNSWGQAYDDLYGVKAINCPAAWDMTTGTGIIVAVIDSGIDYTHPDITNNVWINPGEIPGNGIDDDGNGYVDDVRGWDFIGHNAYTPQQDNDIFDRNGHGTHVAGTIAAQGNNGLGIIGVAWGARVMAVKGLDDSGSGRDSETAKAIVYAANNGADVINASWEGQGTSPVLEDAVNYAASLGVVFVAAAGNDSADEANFTPANCSAAISVAALDSRNWPASFSNFGNRLDVAAPGVDILSLRATNTNLGTPLAQDPGYTRADGTSMAAPHVSGVAALVLSQHPTWSSEQIREVLRSTADLVWGLGRNDFTGYGRVNALRAVQAGPALEARILSPVNESAASPTMTIAGVAQGPGFGSYVLDYGPGNNPTNWLTFATGSSPVNHSTLGTLQTSTLPDRRYTVRLRVFKLDGDSFEDRIQITVDYDFITTPSPPVVPSAAPEYKPGVSIAIVGTVSAPNLRQFRVEWARGVDATNGWTTSDIVLVGDGLGGVTNGLLATWNPGGITQADYYTIRLLSDRTAFTNEAKTYVYLEPDLYSANWPQWIGQCPSGSVLPARDAQGCTRLIVMNPPYLGSGFPPLLWSFALDGSCLTNPLSRGNYGGVAVGDVAAAAGDEVIVADNNRIRVFPANAGAPITTFPPVSTTLQDWLVTLGDLTGDGVPEILALTTGLPTGSNLLYAWTSNGTLVSSNFPIAVAVSTHNLYFYQADSVMPLLSSNGYSEILVAAVESPNTFSLKKYTADGRPATWTNRSFNGYPIRMVSGDVNGDGRREIVLSYRDKTNGVIEVFSPEGATLPDWPMRLGNNEAYVLLADLDRDGVDEILANNAGSMYVLRGDGTSFSSAWLLPDCFAFALSVADVNGDGFPEILASCSSFHLGPGSDESSSYQTLELRAYDRDARLIRSWQLLGHDGHQPQYVLSPVVGDFDGNGKLEIAVNYTLMTDTPSSPKVDHGALTVLALDVPFIRNPHDWPMSYHDPQNSANDFALLTISGTIRSPMGTPIPGVFVSFSNGAATTTTDTHGFYSLALDPGWSGTATPSLVGYSFYPTSESYTNVVASRGGQDYTATTTPNPPPVIGSVSNQFVLVGQQLVITNWASDPDGVMFSLGAGAPDGASITTNGIFTWTPAGDQGSTTNLIVIWATDFGTPPMSNYVAFTVVVPDCIEASLGRSAMLAGTTSSVPVRLLSTTALTNMAFTVVYPAERFDTNFTITVNSAQVLTQQIRRVGTGLVEVTFTLPETSVLHGPTNVAELGFTAVSNQHSAFVPLPITDVTGLKPDGTPVANWYGHSGRVALIGAEPLLEALPADTNNALVILYGHPGTDYILLSTTNGLPVPIWLPETAINATNLETWIFWTNQGEATRFFRVKSE